MNKRWLAPFLLLFSLRYGMAQKPLPSNMFMQSLPNGLAVLVIEDNSVPLATVAMVVRNGAYTETPEFNGLSHLYEHMFFKANKDYKSATAFIGRMQELGLAFNGNTTDEKVSYYFTLPSYNVFPGLQLMNSAIRYPLFDKDEMKRENVVVDAEFQRNESNPGFALNDALKHHLWGDLYSRKNPIGDHQVINSATPEKMKIIKNKYYWPNNSLLIVGGDVNHEDVFIQAGQIFGSWESSGSDPFVQYPVPEMKPLEKSDYFSVASANARAPVMIYAWQGPDTRRDTLNTYVADIFSFILGQNSSKLHKALVESGLALELNTGYLTERYTGPITFRIVPNPSRIKECAAAFNHQLALFDTDDYITDEQLAISKRLFEIRALREQEVTSQFVQTLSFWWCSSGIDYFNTYQDNLNKVTREDIKNYVRKYIKDKPYCAGILLNPQTAQTLKPDELFKPE